MIQTHTACELTVLAKLTAEQIAELTPLIEEQKPSDPDVAEALAENSLIRFESVFEGDTVPFDLLQWLTHNKVSYSWAWEAYEDTGSGRNFYEAEDDIVHIFRTHENLVVIPLHLAVDAEEVRRIKRAVTEESVKKSELGIL